MSETPHGNPFRKATLWAPLGLSLAAWAVYPTVGPAWALPGAAAGTLWAAWLLARSYAHPGLRLRRRALWLAAIALGGTGAAYFIHQSAHRWSWNRAFQLDGSWERFTGEGGWSLLVPPSWSHREERLATATVDLFQPPGTTPPMSVTLSRRTRVGTTDLSLVVENFLLNLPPHGKAEILEEETFTLDSGHHAFRLLYWTPAGRIPLKCEVVFVLDGDSLYALSAEASPKWFDRHRESLRRMITSFLPPPVP